MLLRPLALACLLAAASCADAPPDLSEPLPAGLARAGVVAKAADLIGGPGAEGRVGDFKLYNAKVRIVVQQPGPSNGYGTLGGFIVDADVVRPKGEPGRSLYGEAIALYNRRQPKGLSGSIVNDGADGGPAIVRMKATDDAFPLIEAVIGQARGPMNLDLTIDYVLEPDADFVRVQTRLVNTSNEQIEMGDHLVGYVMGDGLRAFMPGAGFDLPQVPPAADYFAAASEHVSYSFLSLSSTFAPVITFQGFLLGALAPFRLVPKGEDSVESVLVIGDGDLAAHAASHGKILEEAGRDAVVLAPVRGKVSDNAGKPVARAYVHVLGAGDAYVTRARTKADGSFALSVPPGDYRLVANVEDGDLGVPVAADVPPAGLDKVALLVPAVGFLEVVAKENDAPVPVRLEARRHDAPAPPPASFGLPSRVRGADRLEFLPPAKSRLALPPGRYTLRASRGFEYEVETAEVEVKAGETASFAPALRHVVDTAGWLSGDYHVHAQRSADSDDLEEHKVLSFAADHVEVPVNTEHEHIGDYAPVIRRLGLGRWVGSIVGEEVSTTQLGHFNAFPLAQNPLEQNNGAVFWFGVKGADLFGRLRANPARPLVQVNHPRSGSFGSPFIKGYFSAVGFDSATFTVKGPHDWSTDFDAIEIANGGGPDYEDWIAFLDRGMRKLATGDSDSHVARTEPPGYPRNYVFLGTDTPEALDVPQYMAALRAGRLAVSGGYFVETGVGEKRQGELLPASVLVGDALTVDVRVQAPSWVPAGTLEIIVNGAVAAQADIPDTRVERLKRSFSVPIPPGADAHVFARVRGRGALPYPYPGAEAFAFTNPFFVDRNGNGTFDARLPID